MNLALAHQHRPHAADSRAWFWVKLVIATFVTLQPRYPARLAMLTIRPSAASQSAVALSGCDQSAATTDPLPPSEISSTSAASRFRA